MKEADFYAHCLYDVNSEGVVWEDLKIDGGKCGGVDFYGAKFVSCTFIESVFSNAFLALVEFENCSFIDCSFYRTDFNQATFEDTAFVDCRLDKAVFHSIVGINISFSGCEGVGVDFTKAQIDGSFIRNTLPGAMFQGAELSDVYFLDTSLAQAEFDEETVVIKTSFIRCDLTDSQVKEGDGFSREDLEDCVIFPFNLHIDLDAATSSNPILSSILNKVRQVGRSVVGRALNGVVGDRKRANLNIYGCSLNARLYCSDMDVYRKLKRENIRSIR